MKSAATLLVSTAVVAGILVKLDVIFPYFEVPTPNVIGPLFRLDGEAHYNTDLLEIWLELWLVLLVLVFGIRWAHRARREAKLRARQSNPGAK
jgi:hypothetical protein